MRRLTAGTRGSDLARAQTDRVCGRLTDLYPQLRIAVSIIKTGGDVHADRPLSAWAGAGAFTRELEEALLAKQIDFAVHSLKDLPTDQPPGLIVAAIPERGQVEDVLFTDGRHTLATLPAGARVGTSSPRRGMQLRTARPDLRIEQIRGNVPTRLRRVCEGALDAVVLARAGLVRLGLDRKIAFCTLDADLMLPAPGQGALAIEIREADRDLAQWLQALHDPATADAVGCERMVLKAFGGGCRAPIAVLAQAAGPDHLRIRAFAASEDGCDTAHISEDVLIANLEEESRRIGISLRRRLWRDVEGAFQVPDSAPVPGLSGRRIVITRALDQSEALQRLLEHAGAAVRLIPTIEIVPDPNDGLAENASPYDWIVFTSANAVRCWSHSAHAARLAASSAATPRAAVIGPATYHAATRCGIRAVLPLTATAEGMYTMLEAAAHPLAGKRFLLPRSDKARLWLAEKLRGAGATVDHPVVYRTLYRTLSEHEKRLLCEFPPHAVLFMSPSAVEGMQQACPLTERAAWQSFTAAVAIGPSTAEAARSAGFSRVFESPEQSAVGLMRFLKSVLRNSAPGNGEPAP